jgi:hypothetical protein
MLTPLEIRRNDMTWYTTVLIAHVSFGAIALMAFWVTAALKKGTRTHRNVGTAYLMAMLAVIISALPLAVAAFAAGHTRTGVFLAYLIVITATPLWVGRRAVRRRYSAAEFSRSPYQSLGVTNIACAAVVLGLGIATGTPLLVGLSVVGFFIGIRIVRFAANPPTSRQWWLKQHYLSMIGSGVASHIAFLNIGLPRLVPKQFGGAALYVAWFGPLAVATLAAWWLNRRYGRGADGVRLTSPQPVA